MPSRNLKLLYCIEFLVCCRPYWPVAVIYFEQIAGSYALAMAVFSIIFLSQAALEVPMGLFSDAFGRRKTMILGAICASTGISCYALASGFELLAIGGILEGTSRALFSGTDRSILYEILKAEGREEELNHYVGRTGALNQAAMGISAAVGGALAFYSLWSTVIASVLPQIAVLFISLQLEETGSQDNPANSSLRNMLIDAFRQFKTSAQLRLIALAQTIEFGVGEALFYFQGVFFQALVPVWVLGPVRSLNHLTGFAGFWFAGHIAERFGSRATLLWTTFLSNTTKIFAVIFPSPITPFIFSGCNFAYGPGEAARVTLLHQGFTDAQRATMNSIVSLVGSILFSIVSLGLGYLADHTSAATAMLVGLGINAGAVGIYFRVKR